MKTEKTDFRAILFYRSSGFLHRPVRRQRATNEPNLAEVKVVPGVVSARIATNGRESAELAAVTGLQAGKR